MNSKVWRNFGVALSDEAKREFTVSWQL